jgi:probable sporulation protein (polysaccharide deacetylase family)
LLRYRLNLHTSVLRKEMCAVKRLIVLLVLIMFLATVFFVGRIPSVGEKRVAQGVTLRGETIGGLTESELLGLLGTLKLEYERPTVQPFIDPVTRGAIPGLSGREMDLEASVKAALSAPPDSVLELIIRTLPPDDPPEELPIFQGNPAKKQIALVVNVAWGNDELLEMLSIFEREAITCTFFLVGRWADAFPHLVQEIYQRGHEFGNHAYSDPHLPKLSADKIAEEISRTTEAIRRAVGEVPVPFFSPPYNDYNQVVLDVAASSGYRTVLCSLDTADWMRPGVDRIVRRIVPRAHNGAIVLMHPTEQTPAALELIIPGLQHQGYELVTVSRLLCPDTGF